MHPIHPCRVDQLVFVAQIEAYLKERGAAGRRSSIVNTRYWSPLRSLFLPFCAESGLETADHIANGLLVDFTIQVRDQRRPKVGRRSPRFMST